MGPKMKKFLARTGVILLIIVALALGLRAVLNFTTGRALGRHLARLQAEGKLPAPGAGYGPPCADEENAAVLWKSAEPLFSLDGRDREALGRLYKTASGPNLEASWSGLEAADKDRLRQMAAKNRRVIDILREASARRCFRYIGRTEPIFYGHPYNAVRVVQTTKIMVADALLSADDGRPRDGVEELLDGLKFAELCRQEPQFISYLVAMADARTILRGLNIIVSRYKPDPEVIEKAFRTLEGPSWRTELARVSKDERLGTFLAFGSRVIRGEPIAGYNTGFRKVWFWILRPAVKDEIHRMMGGWEELDKSIVQPYYRKESASGSFEGFLMRLPGYYRISRLLVPNMDASVLKAASLEAKIEAARIGLACRIYRLRTGALPAKIGDLVPGILKEEPLDPFTGQPFVYRVGGDGFIVYSLGANKKDDGGRESEIVQMIMPKDDDWAWRDGMN